MTSEDIKWIENSIEKIEELFESLRHEAEKINHEDDLSVLEEIIWYVGRLASEANDLKDGVNELYDEIAQEGEEEQK